MYAFDSANDAFIENDTMTTVGIHRHCPHRRFVGGTSRYVCECQEPAVQAIRDRTGPATLEECDGRFPMADRVQQLLDEGKEDQARKYAKEAQDAWVAKAKTGAIMNLSDLLASSETMHIHDSDKKRRKQ